VFNDVVTRLKKAYAGVMSRIGDPLLSDSLIGPLHTSAAVEAFKTAVANIVKSGGKIEFGGKVSDELRYLHFFQILGLRHIMLLDTLRLRNISSVGQIRVYNV
jgi:acyl-CoA reductase-like NAD-dependent aldehyde dehydrogenase